jgi:mitogen-activated protein kinase organizer 1
MLLVSTLDSTLRALDLDTGRSFGSFTGHKNTSYRAQAAFGPGEATVVMGDEDGKVWGWDVESVRSLRLSAGFVFLRVN